MNAVSLEVIALIRDHHERALNASPLFSTEHWKHNAGHDWPDADDGTYLLFENCVHPMCRWAREVAK